MRATPLFLARVAAVLALAPFAGGAEDEPTPPSRPNILLILADDLGYGELGCQGNPEIPTPHIDSLAAHGVRFTSGYVTGPVCGPTRAGLLTGRYQQRFGFEFNLGGSGAGLSLKETTIADRLKAAGYATGMFGKWHLGFTPENRPRKRGFDWFYGFLPACRPYPCRPGEMGQSLLPDSEKAPRYTSDALAAEAAAFMEQHRQQPWFAYLAFGAVHASPTGGKKLVPADAGHYQDRFSGIADPQRRIFAGMLAGLDEGVGTVLAKLRELKLEENTLIFFLSDNGGPTWQTTSRNDPLRGSKGDVLEGGIRVPFLVQWKGRLPAGRIEPRPVISLDILPTALAAASVPVDDTLEGISLLPLLAGQGADTPRGALCWRYGKKHAVRLGDWKLADQGQGPALYDLATDFGETNNLAGREPEKFQELQAAYDRWNTQNIPPRWGGEGKPRRGAR